ncbi:hypothetical protein CC79DRAFT_1330788 [Sarocladium strictum]
MATSASIDPSWPSTVVGQVWLYDTNQPSFVNVEVKTAQDSAWVFDVSCPTEECDEGEYSPETVTTYSNGRVEGARTADSTTTYWDCFYEPSEYLEADSFSTPVTVTVSQLCAATTGVDISRPDQATATPMMEFDDSCEWVKRKVVAVTTAGMDLAYEYRPYEEMEVTPDVEMVQSNIDALSKELCATTTRTPDPDFPGAGPETTGTETTTPEMSTTETGGSPENTDEDGNEEVEEGGTGRMSPSAVLVGMLAISAIVISGP